MAVELSSIIVDTYEGDTEDEKFHGAGLLLFKSGNAYTGMFANGFMEGSGVYKWADGVTYIGEFKKNRMTGSGEYQWTNGCSYQGNVRNGFRHGRGFCESTPMGSTYDGEWSDGKQCGKGTMTYREGAHHRYEGSWLDGKKHGQGVMCYASGNEYSGDWKENVKEGWGRMFWRDRHEEYEGEWKEGQPNGRGVYIWRTASTVRHRHPMHNRYDGTWLDGKRSGFGVFEYATGARYEGEWVNNIKHGPGIYVTEHGRRYNGLFQNDRMVVEFEKYRNDAPFVFAVSDMLPKDFDQIVEEQLININHAIMRYTSELRNIYETYSKYNHLPAQHPSHSMMTRLELWKLIKDCQLQKRNITLAQMDRAYAVTFQADDVFKCKYDYPHLATERFILYDFLEALVRISHLLNKGRENLSIYEKSVAAEFSHLLKHDIVPKARGGGGGPSATAAQSGPLYTKWRSESTIESVEAELKDEMEHEYFGALNSMYGDLCCPGLRSLAGSVGDQTMTLRDVIQKLMEYEVIDAEEKGPLTVKTLINIFSADLPAVQVDEDYNLDYEIVSYELFEYLFECFRISKQDLIAKVAAAIEEHRERSLSISTQRINSSHDELNSEPQQRHVSSNTNESSADFNNSSGSSGSVDAHVIQTAADASNIPRNGEDPARLSSLHENGTQWVELVVEATGISAPSAEKSTQNESGQSERTNNNESDLLTELHPVASSASLQSRNTTDAPVSEPIPHVGPLPLTPTHQKQQLKECARAFFNRILDKHAQWKDRNLK